jgi:hypothetical protein
MHIPGGGDSPSIRLPGRNTIRDDPVYHIDRKRVGKFDPIYLLERGGGIGEDAIFM